MTARQPGRLYGIGVGPGDPELLTLKALRLMRAASIVAYPAPEQGDSFARTIVSGWLDRGQQEIAIRFPMRPGPPPVEVYDEAVTTIGAALEAGDDVALLCQGDPLVYGSFIGVLSRLADRYPIEIVPGVSSLTAAAAAAGVPLAARNESLMVVPATLDEGELSARLTRVEVGLIVKLGRHLAKVQRVLQHLGMLSDALYVEHATLPDQQVRPLAEIDEAPYFSIAFVRTSQRLGT